MLASCWRLSQSEAVNSNGCRLHVGGAHLDGLGLAGASRPKGVAAPEGEHGCSQGHVAPVCQRCNDQPSIVALVFVPIREYG